MTIHDRVTIPDERSRASRSAAGHLGTHRARAASGGRTESCLQEI
jgi:hypothetical protein